MKEFIAIGALAALLALPAAGAAISTQDIAGPILALDPAGLALEAPAVLYLTEEGDVWQESNGYDGLQTSPIVDEEGHELAPADSFVAGASMLPAL
jgi:hypothetical protein